MTVGVRSLLLLAHRFGAQFHFLRGHRKQFRIVESARRVVHKLPKEQGALQTACL
jgi:predicted secreted protein